jgi:hypothetical protein
MNAERTNTDRSQRALRALCAYVGEGYGNDPEHALTHDPDVAFEAMGDLLCDLRHLADRTGVTFADADSRAARHYYDEGNNDDEGEWEPKVPKGIHWMGPGSEVQREDVPESRGEPVYEGDMEAALAVARETDCHWLSYAPQLEDEPWLVLAHSGPEAAEKDARSYDVGSFAWDGRLGAPPEHPSGVGFAPHPESIYRQDP